MAPPPESIATTRSGLLCLEKAADPVLWWDPDGRILYANQSARTTFDVIEGITLSYDLDLALSAERWPSIWALIEQQGSLRYDTQLTRGEDEPAFDCEVSATYIADPEGDFVLVIAHDRRRHDALQHELIQEQEELEQKVSLRTEELTRLNLELRREIADRRKIEVALRMSELKYRMIANNVSDVVWTSDLEGRLTFVSPSITRILGHAEIDVLHAAGRELLTAESAKAFRPQLRELLLQRDPEASRTLRLEVHHREGHTVPCETTLRIFYDDDDKAIGLIGVLRDISSREVMEQALVDSERMAAVGTLAGGVAHEFNNINAIVLGYAERCQRHPELPEAARSGLVQICRAALRAKNVTSNLLSFAAPRVSREEVANLVQVIEEILELKEKALATAGISIDKRLEPIPSTLMNAYEMGQVVLNLLTNAEHALIDRPDPMIALQTIACGSEILFRITDNGWGIREEDREHIFNPFFSTKGEHAKVRGPLSKVRGTGLGLSVSHTIVSNHGGRITVESREGEGTAFDIWLPVRGEDDGREGGDEV